MAEIRQRALPATPKSAPGTPSSSAFTRKQPPEIDPKMEQQAHEVESIKAEYAPEWPGAWKVLLLVALASALFNIVGDCDEVFNYWEPTHFLHHGRSLQTWEYRSLVIFNPLFDI